jgi:hypothetical protein
MRTIGFGKVRLRRCMRGRDFTVCIWERACRRKDRKEKTENRIQEVARSLNDDLKFKL